jgi:hypothetical protein
MKSFAPTAAALTILFVACDPETRDEAAFETPAEPTVELADEPTAIADEGPESHLIYRPDEVEWEDGPASFESGAEFAVLEGDPAEAGVFTMQIRMPDGFQISPHWHPNVERVTVLSGTFFLGSGEALDIEAAEPLPAASYTSIPPEIRHFAIAENETVIQLTSIGPWEINYVDPSDDPRQSN